MEVDKTTWFKSLPDSDQEAIREEAVEYFAYLIETGSVTMELSGGKFVLSLTITQEG